MNPVAITDWHKYLQDGDNFLQTALAGAKRRAAIFTPEILYNLVAMAIEKQIMGFIMSRGDLAENHTMTDLLRALAKHAEVPADLARDLLYLDSFQEICDLNAYKRRPPTPAETSRILAIGSELQTFINLSLQRCRPAA
ncbi:MAG: hypothetical protein OEV73_02720 [Desulfobulbaceae bacterium]|nr:hypothetical protein [Desulfobulbaceae bacterium]